MTSTTLPFKMPDRTSSQKNLSLDGLSRLEEGIFYGDELAPGQQSVFRAYVTEQNEKRAKGELKLRLYERRIFVEKVMYTAIQAEAAIVAFNLPLICRGLLSNIALRAELEDEVGALSSFGTGTSERQLGAEQFPPPHPASPERFESCFHPLGRWRHESAVSCGKVPRSQDVGLGPPKPESQP